MMPTTLAGRSAGIPLLRELPVAPPPQRAVKERVSELAIFGGVPAFDQPLHVGRPNIGNREHLLQRINQVLDNRWLTNDGPMVREFEQKIAQLLGVANCIAVANATVGLELVARALELKGEVILPSFTFVATAHAMLAEGLTPVFCDVDPETHHLDPTKVEELITDRTSAVVGVHLWGRPCNIERLTQTANRRGLRLIFDAAHAFACSHHGRMIGNFGDAEVFSFHATKFLNTFEGGAIVTNNNELAEKLRLMRNFGFAGYDRVVAFGTNAKMPEVSAAMGLTGLEELDDFIQANRRHYQTYRRLLQEIPGISALSFNEAERRNFQYVIVEVDAEQFGLTRDQLVDVLHAENVIARRYFYPGCHRMEPYRSINPQAGEKLPQTQRLCERVMVLPTGTSIDEGDVRQVCALIQLTAENADQVGAKLAVQ